MSQIYDIPVELTVLIFKKVKLKHLIGDDMLEKFVIKHCNVSVEDMLYCLVKKRRLERLVQYTIIQDVNVVSTGCVKRLIALSVKQHTFRITIHLCKVFKNMLHDLCESVVTNVIKSYLKALKGADCIEQCLLCKTHHAFLEYYILLCKVENIHNPLINKETFLSIINHKHSQVVVDVLLYYGCLRNICEAIVNDPNDIMTTRIVNAIISNNNVSLMKYMVYSGYSVMICDVIIGIAFADFAMVSYLCSFFKPRWYSRRFCEILKSIAFRSNDKRIYRLVKNKMEQ